MSSLEQNCLHAACGVHAFSHSTTCCTPPMHQCMIPKLQRQSKAVSLNKFGQRRQLVLPILHAAILTSSLVTFPTARVIGASARQHNLVTSIGFRQPGVPLGPWCFLLTSFLASCGLQADILLGTLSPPQWQSSTSQDSETTCAFLIKGQVR